MKFQTAPATLFACAFSLLLTIQPALSQSPDSIASESPPLPALDLSAEAEALPEEDIPLRSLQDANEAKALIEKGKMQIQAEDPATGQTVTIDISSDELVYEPETNEYIVSGNVYIIIPEKKTEILADKVTFNSKTSNMIALGNVFIISDEKVIGSDKVNFDLKNSISYHERPKTVTREFRIEAKTAQRSDHYLILHEGRLILDSEALKRIRKYYPNQRLRIGRGAGYAIFSASQKEYILQGGAGNLLAETQEGNTELDDPLAEEGAQEIINPLEPFSVIDKPISPKDVASADFSPDNNRYRITVKTVNVYRKPKGFDEIVLKQAMLRYDNIPVGFLPALEFGYQEEKRFINYLGPDIGYNVDLGGLYAGPGWDFRFLNGWIRYSPILSYGGGQRLRVHRGTPTYVEPQYGIGFLGNYRSPSSNLLFGYTSTLRESIFIFNQELFGGSGTRLRVAANQLYTNGFFSIERPRFIGEIMDSRQFLLPGNLRFSTFVSAGIAKDDFFPTRQRRYFVRPTSPEPITTSRIQLQGQLRNAKPLLSLGNFMSIGALVQSRLAFYGTGDTHGIVQGGPVANLILGPFFSQARYFYSQTAGRTPFVFDSYYRGRNNLQTINSVDLGKYLTVGMFHSLNLNKDNARKDMIVGQRLFFSTGSKTIRFSMAYDMLQKRSYFGFTLNPEGGQSMIHFDSLNVYQPDYNPHLHDPAESASVVAPK